MNTSRPASLAAAIVFFAMSGFAVAQAPSVLRPTGPYVQAASGQVFPEAVNEFIRRSVVRYSPDGSDESANYHRIEAGREIAGSVYVFPSPSLTSFGSPREVASEARSTLCGNYVGEVKQEIAAAFRNPTLLGEEDVTLMQGGMTLAGRKVSYTVSVDSFFGRPLTARSEAYVFCYVGGTWTVKYRFTYPDHPDSRALIADFMRDLSLTIVGRI